MKTHDRKFFEAMDCPKKVTWTKDIKQMFTAKDIAHMKRVANFDLGNYEDVMMYASAIYSRVEDGSMPPAGSGEKQWPQEWIDTFGCWIKQNCPE